MHAGLPLVYMVVVCVVGGGCQCMMLLLKLTQLLASYWRLMW